MSTGKYVVHIGWGEMPEDGFTTGEYRFDTQAELDAFMLGISEMDGWNDYEVFEQPMSYVVNDDGDGEWVPDNDD